VTGADRAGFAISPGTARVAPYKRIRAVRLASHIPRTPAGKTRRRVLIEEDRAAAGSERYGVRFTV